MPLITPSSSFVQRFEEKAGKISPFCLGIDPSRKLLEDWGFEPTIKDLCRFCDIVLKAAKGCVGIVKPQTAFFEAFGPEGYKALQELIIKAKEDGHIVIADAKRGDTPDTVEAYAESWIGEDSAFRADAVTALPWFGIESLKPLIERAVKNQGAAFIVLRPSTRSSAWIQNASIDDGKISLADELAHRIDKINHEIIAEKGNGDILDRAGPLGVVIGATLTAEHRRQTQHTIAEMPHSLFLVPGIGTQGGSFATVGELFGDAVNRVIPIVSRSILKQGPNPERLAEAIRECAEKAAQLYRGASSSYPPGSERAYRAA